MTLEKYHRYYTVIIYNAYYYNKLWMHALSWCQQRQMFSDVWKYYITHIDIVSFLYAIEVHNNKLLQLYAFNETLF